MDQDGFYYVSVRAIFYSAFVMLVCIKHSFWCITGRSVRTPGFGPLKLSAAAAVGLEENALNACCQCQLQFFRKHFLKNDKINLLKSLCLGIAFAWDLH